MIVIDANLLIAMVSGDQRGPLVLQKFNEWIGQGDELIAPSLAQFEVANGLTRLIVASAFQVNKAEAAWNEISLLPIVYHPLRNFSRVIEIALRLGRQNAYDAAYLALAETLGAELWTLDGPLYRNASGQGFPVQLLS